jgi:hypothetical protein
VARKKRSDRTVLDLLGEKGYWRVRRAVDQVDVDGALALVSAAGAEPLAGAWDFDGGRRETFRLGRAVVHLEAWCTCCPALLTVAARTHDDLGEAMTAISEAEEAEANMHGASNCARTEAA